MKRSILFAVALSLAAVLLSSSSGGAQTTGPRAAPEQVTAATSPARDRFRPYTFTTSGRIVPPTKICAPGTSPGTGAANCIPIRCPPGTTDVSYCLVPSRAVICSGIVNVRIQKARASISSRNVAVRPDCTYRSRVSFRLLVRTRQGVLSVRARFQGNEVLAPRSSATHRVRAG